MAAEELRRKHIETLEVCQRLVDENAKLRKSGGGGGGDDGSDLAAALEAERVKNVQYQEANNALSVRSCRLHYPRARVPLRFNPTTTPRRSSSSSRDAARRPSSERSS